MPSCEGSVLIVDDEKNICQLLSRLVNKEGLKTFTANDGQTALKMIISDMPDILIVDFKMPGMDGMEVIRRAREIDPDLPAIMITAYADLHTAVEAMKAGAYDFLAKPFLHDEFMGIILGALQEKRDKKKLHTLSSHLRDSHDLMEIMGPSNAVDQVIRKVVRVAKSCFTVVLQGETGSGKELVARSIHAVSPRANAPFVPLDCGAIPETLLESELFGYEKGAFTGAERQKPGKLELANGGTLLLDEISNMPLGSQAKLLRVLQDKQLFRVGGTKCINIDVRLIVATNKDLRAAVEADIFRRDLFYRLNEFPIRIPPLRERKEDIIYLAKRFLDITNLELGKMVKGFTDDAMEFMIGYDWPGNVRELRSSIRRAVLIADDMIDKDYLNLNFKEGGRSGTFSTPLTQIDPWDGQSLREIIQRSTLVLEREVIEEALKHTSGNKAKAARLLHIDYKTMHTKVKRMRIFSEGGQNGREKG